METKEKTLITVECSVKRKKKQIITGASSRIPEDKKVNCGWFKDKFGLSLQIVPTILSKLLSAPAKAGRVTNTFLQMKKFDIEKLMQA